MQCVARITSASGDWDGHLPVELSQCAAKWSNDQSEETGKVILEKFSKHLKASFLPKSIPELCKYLDSDTDLSAIEVLPFAFDFDENNEPVIGAYAVFDIPFKQSFTSEMLQSWAGEDGGDLTWCICFFWEIDGRRIYLDVYFKEVTITPLE